MPEDDVTTELERLRAENAQLKRAANRGVSLKVSEKGGVSVYGLGRFPVTLYKEQWIFTARVTFVGARRTRRCGRYAVISRPGIRRCMTPI